MIRKLALAISLIATLTTTLMANSGPGNTIQVKGTVTDEKGQPLTGAEVKVEGSNTKVYTDFDGNFSLDVSKANSSTIVVTYIAYKEEKIVLNTVQNNAPQPTIQLKKRSKK